MKKDVIAKILGNVLFYLYSIVKFVLQKKDIKQKYQFLGLCFGAAIALWMQRSFLHLVNYVKLDIPYSLSCLNTIPPPYEYDLIFYSNSDESYYTDTLYFQTKFLKYRSLVDILEKRKINKLDIRALLASQYRDEIVNTATQGSLELKYNCKIEYKDSEFIVNNAVLPDYMKKNRVCFIISMQFNTKGEKLVSTRREGSELVFNKSSMVTKTNWKFTEVNVNSSVYQDALDAGIPAYVVQKYLSILESRVKFNTNVQKGDKALFVFEEIISSKGNLLRYGDLMYAGMSMRRHKNVNLYNYKGSYYNEKGEYYRLSKFGKPVEGPSRISSRFGPRKHPVLGIKRWHKGVDFAAPRGSRIISAESGTVETKQFSSSYGNYVVVNHGKGVKTLYAHLDRFNPKLARGQKITRGHFIGHLGATGIATGPHLHYELIINGKKTDFTQL